MKLAKFIVIPGCVLGLKYLHDGVPTDGYERLKQAVCDVTNTFTVSAKCKIPPSTFHPTFPLPENAEYAGDLGCHKTRRIRKRLYVAHMYRGTTKKTIEAQRKHLRQFKIDPKAEFVYCPSSLHLNHVRKTYPDHVSLGIQNIYVKDYGNYTGELSIEMAKDVGAQYVLLGANHRRAYLGETNKFINAKIRHVLNNDMKCLIFLSNTTGRFDECSHDKSILKQLEAVLDVVRLDEWNNVAFAYESVCQGYCNNQEMITQAQRCCKMIRDKLQSLIGSDIAQGVRIIYSGDIDHSNAPDLMSEEDIDGLVFSPRHNNECFINVINSGILSDKRKQEQKKHEELDNAKKSCIIVHEEIMN